MSKRAFVGGIAVGWLVTASVYATSDNKASDEATPEPETVTVTERVEIPVPGPTVTERVSVWTDECEYYADLVDSTWHEIDAYEDGIAPQQQLLYDTLGAIIESDTNAINDAITAQNHILNDTAGPLARVIENQPKLAEARTECLATLEDQ